jgi:ribosomal protein S18 acetylase RimI-like enzyme
MNLRPLQAEDVPVCARLMAESPLWQRYHVTQASATRRFEQGLARQATIAVADLDGEVAGFIWYDTQGTFGRSGYIMLVGVRSELRSQGVGQALMAHAETEMYRLVQDIFLLVSDFNEPAQRFYNRLGYRQVGRIPDYVIPGIAELIFHKRNPYAGNQATQ